MGYVNGLRYRNTEPESSLVKEGNYVPASGQHAMNTLLSQTPRHGAVFIASELVATRAMLAVKRAGLRILDEVAIVGFDDIPMPEHMDPLLTTVRLPAYGLGCATGERLVQLTRGEASDETGILLDSELIVRESATEELMVS